MRNLYLVDETFDEHFTDTYHLALEGDLEGFTYCMLDTRVNKCVLLRHYEIGAFAIDIALEKLENVIANDEMISKPFKTSTFIFKSPKASLIPDEFFSPENIKKMFEFQTPLGEYDELHYYKIEKLKSTLIFSVPSRIADLLKRKMPKVKVVHENALILENLLKYNDDSDMLISFTNDFFHIAVISQDQLRFFNSFSFKAPADAVFYIAGVATQMGLKTDSLKLSIAGEFEKNSELGNALKNTFRNIRFKKGASDFEYSYKFREVDAHVFANLFNSFTCVL